MNLSHLVPADLASKIWLYMQQHKYRVDGAPGNLNIIYLEGANKYGFKQRDVPDRWNDLSLLMSFVDGTPKIVFSGIATTEPGLASTHSAGAKKLGGVARICLGQQIAWRPGFHKGDFKHPALVQVDRVLVHRDANKDGWRTGDTICEAYGINQHGTNEAYDGISVGYFSAGCLVRKYWAAHMLFIRMVLADQRLNDKKFVFPTTVIGADSLHAEIK